jgi:hypothetical protein
MAVATTTLVRSDGVLRKIRDSRFIGLLDCRVIRPSAHHLLLA